MIEYLIPFSIIITAIAVVTGIALFCSEYKAYSGNRSFEYAQHLRWATCLLALSPFTMIVIPIALVGGLGYVVWKTCVRFVPFVQTIISAFKLREDKNDKVGA